MVVVAATATTVLVKTEVVVVAHDNADYITINIIITFMKISNKRATISF